MNITVEGQSVEQASKFRYLGLLISEDYRCLDDVKTRRHRQGLDIVKAAVFRQYSKLCNPASVLATIP